MESTLSEGSYTGGSKIYRIRIASLNGLTTTITTTRNFWTAVFLGDIRKKYITFRDGTSFSLTKSQYWKVRDAKEAGYCVEQVDDDLFKIKGNEITLIGSSDMLQAVCEIRSGFYDWDCRGKIVLDVGGFQGESAVFFSKNGAKKVIIYEPAKAHHEIIKKNMLLNGVNAEIHEEGIGNKNGTVTVRYEMTDLSFGLTGGGQKKMQIKIRNLAEVIQESRADIAKFNCEGAEESIIGLDSEVLKKIEVYMIMAHTPEIGGMILDKLKQSGFNLVRKNWQQSFLCFKKGK